jgi:hypothetical protein
MNHFPATFLTYFSVFLRSHHNLGLEILALRQQLGVLKRKNPRPRLRMRDRMFWDFAPPTLACMVQRPGHC